MPTDIAPEEDVPFEQPDQEPVSNSGEFSDSEIDPINVSLNLSEDEEKEIVGYLEENLPKMRPSKEDDDRVRSYLAMYEQAVQRRVFPYENAPSAASSDATDALNEWLDNAETAFLQQNVTFAIDREETSMAEEAVRRVEKTFHRKFFIKSGLRKDTRLILFEAGYLGGSIVAPRQSYDIRPVREKVVIRNEKDLNDNIRTLSEDQINKAKEFIEKGKIWTGERDILRMLNVGPILKRIDQTKFWFPRNAKHFENWQVVAEPEFYTRSALESMAEQGLVSKSAVQKAVQERRQAYSRKQESEEDKKKTTEDVKPHELDSNWASEMDSIRKYGDSYDDEFAVYRVTMLYKAKTKQDPNGRLRSWIEVLYCPAGNNILTASFCEDGEFPYRVLQFRPVPYKAIGPGIAQQRFNHNMVQSDIMSLFLASLEQEIGSPLMIREGSGLYASGFRAYPASVCYTVDPKNDAAFLPFPEKSRLAVEGIKMILGTNVMANKGADYASGKREEVLLQQKQTTVKARIHSIALDFDEVYNLLWRMFCRISKMNTDDKKYVPWVYEKPPQDQKLYVLESEMNPELTWTCALSALSLTPDARLQKAIVMKDILHDKVPASVNSPRLTIGWSKFIADHFDEMTPDMKQALLPTEEDFQALQAQLGAQGGQRLDQTPAAAQSPGTSFRQPNAQR